MTRKSKSELIDSGNAYIVKIKNKYLFKSSVPDESHYYVVFKESPSDDVHAVELSHIYARDQHGLDLKSKDYYSCEMKFPQLYLPSGVLNYYYDRNFYGRKINIENPNVEFVSGRPLSKKQFSLVKGSAYRARRYDFRKGKSFYKKNNTP